MLLLVHLGDLAIDSFLFPPPPELALSLGFPPLDNETVTHCTAYGANWPSCTRARKYLFQIWP